MKENKWEFSQLISGILWILAGLAFILWQGQALLRLNSLVAWVIGLQGIFRILAQVIFDKNAGGAKNRIFQLFVALGQVVVAFIMLSFPISSTYFLMRVIGIYQLLMGLVSFVSYCLMRLDHVPNRLKRLLFALVHLIFALASLFLPIQDHNVLFWLGLYLVFIGLTYISDARTSLPSRSQDQKIKRRFRFPVPIVFNLLEPNRLANKLNHFIRQEVEDELAFSTAYQDYMEENETGAVDSLQVLVQTSNAHLDLIGHLNIAYHGTVYSYGNHDVDSGHLFRSIGDGVLCKIDHQKSIEFELANGITIFEYDIQLNQRQKEALEAKLAQIDDLLIPWSPKTESQWDSFGGRLKRATNCDMFKFKTGQYKTYFVFGSNCVLFCDEIIGSIGLDQFLMVGVMTPGTYFDYFNKQYEKGSTPVINRRIYSTDLLQFTQLDRLKDR
ncbi:MULTISPECIES: HdeD family acid-resistance protein [Aerococcus]|uniref:DUF308 domain-containing protein n=1 Tax=Aerococcus tenax TaxID=3078812 RepID=A0A5N1BKE8_9LACT|nr:DUF308 domain-containing protein [Aerococcus urinae]KAA9239800.1 hypothetical protein F6I34_06090 [Aerococcus urinae]MDK6370554.1 DUF308 domain-containing protein [Aerococcus urinae]MDK6596774.1 DUF308 domain-containing protein [Aerococcus urinae]MDK7302238.1 DUF308 domain-containing protein [Aerococcus urinae]MDK7800811.1 DUF308 domain-containing protein [Aerococcus urinae]